jgi:hypothetical protein
LANGENEEEVTNFLKRLKTILPKDPFLILIDFSAALAAAAVNVFPNAKIGHDYFHTTKLFYDALLKEMMRLQKQAFILPIKECQQLNRHTLACEKSNSLSSLQLKEVVLLDSWNRYREFFSLIFATDAKHFIILWDQLKQSSSYTSWKFGAEFINSLEATFPNCGITEKNYQKIWERGCQIWRRLVRNLKKEWFTGKKGFSKARYSILTKLKENHCKNTTELEIALQKYPFLQPIRDGVLKFHEQFSISNKQPKSLAFLQDLIKKETHEKLKSAITTLIEHEEEIFVYEQISLKHPELRKGKSIRSNHEEINLPLRRVARNQFGLRDTPSARVRMAGVLRCPVIVSETLWKKENENL